MKFLSEERARREIDIDGITAEQQASHVRYSARMRLTDCCGAYSTIDEGVQYCKRCYAEVSPGEGDGGAFLSPDESTVLSAPSVFVFDLKSGRVTEEQRAPASLYAPDTVEWIR